jgi:hypothetical protein
MNENEVAVGRKDNRLIFYQTEDGRTKIDVRLENNTVWLNREQMAELFQINRTGISRHVKNIFEDNEVDYESNVQKMRIANSDRPTEYFSLNVILAVGYRANSAIAVNFRRWATSVLLEYIRKGFALNDELLKQAGGGGYWKELLARIRDIRSSEKVFYKQILEIYATSVDYDKKAPESVEFFKIVQNKMHFAAHGHTAAEIEHLRADSEKPFMGLTTWSGAKPKKEDVTVAKNYLNSEELDILNRITTAYLEFAELQAINQNLMTMKDWIAKLDDFLKLSGRELLDNAGKISKLEADNKALAEYAKYKEIESNELSEVEKHFLESVKETQKKLEKNRP